MVVFLKVKLFFLRKIPFERCQKNADTVLFFLHYNKLFVCYTRRNSDHHSLQNKVYELDTAEYIISGDGS